MLLNQYVHACFSELINQVFQDFQLAEECAQVNESIAKFIADVN